MHRDIKLIENGVEVAIFGSDHNDHNGSMLESDLINFINKVQKKKQSISKTFFMELIKTRMVDKESEPWNWKEELKKAYRESFPYLQGD